ncbi:MULTISPECIES: IS5 family transposase [unclassified Streptomyces]|uniref:IS5 family transposase n=1 Tax=unclassified Streptomyces TaxID=2593676 RepID=UPI0008238AAF|nr:MULTISPECIES: IS5 family transposase [unclassified Streptomyces]MYT95864.1 IS5 family transposase [Streptomyces sp. SID8350]MYU01145.1 IS5 family transposase [Streptomyces sp. SID8350]MYU01302.1 IS5 family transposase [Streptomyces sp. SID8350]SCK60097.1 Transposase [Streptomyces sp. AmelKG-D3]SCK62857.1 Transposase [Streptomyces sp. AmelKG-D3]
MTERRRYPSDLSDARWELVEPVLTAWRAERRGRGLDIGRPPNHDLRSLLDAVLYVNRTGIPWRYLPHDYPHWNTVYAYFARWQEEGVFDQLNSLLRRQVRRQEGRGDEPTACVIDSQSIKTSTNVPATGQGIDAGKKIVGRKRSIVIDTVGLLLGVLVTAASVQDSTAGRTLIEQIAAEHPTIRKTWVDGGYRQHLVEHAATLGIDMHIVRRAPTTRGFTVLPRRWTVERTLGWLMNYRRLARDYEAHPHRSEAMIHLAMINLMTRRLTAESTPTWRGA